MSGVLNFAIRFLDTATGEQVGPVMQHFGIVTGVDFSPTEDVLLSGSHDLTARLWNATTGESLGGPLEHDGFVTAVAFDGRGERFATASLDGTVRIFRAARSKWAAKLWSEKQATGLMYFTFSGDSSRFLIVEDNTLQLWDVSPPRPIGPSLQASSPYLQAVLASDGTTALGLRRDWFAQAWNMATGMPLSAEVRLPDLNRLHVLSPDGHTIFGVDPQGAGRLFDVRGEKLKENALAAADGSLAAAFSPDGRLLLTAGSDGLGRLWDAVSGRQLSPEFRFAKPCRSMVFSPDRRRLLVEYAGNVKYTGRTVQVWNVANAFPIGGVYELPGSLKLGADGRSVLSILGDGSTTIWDAQTGKRVGRPIYHNGGPNDICLSANATKLISLDPESQPLIWHLPAPLANDINDISRWIERITGLELDRDGVVHVQSNAATTPSKQVNMPPPR